MVNVGMCALLAVPHPWLSERTVLDAPRPINESASARTRSFSTSKREDQACVSILRAHAQIDTTQTYTTIRPPQLKQAVAFYEDRAQQMLGEGD